MRYDTPCRRSCHIGMRTLQVGGNRPAHRGPSPPGAILRPPPVPMVRAHGVSWATFFCVPSRCSPRRGEAPQAHAAVDQQPGQRLRPVAAAPDPRAGGQQQADSSALHRSSSHSQNKSPDSARNHQMAGVKGKSGGARPNSGGKRSGAGRKPKAKADLQSANPPVVERPPTPPKTQAP